jgi:hypothetical protein
MARMQEDPRKRGTFVDFIAICQISRGNLFPASVGHRHLDGAAVPIGDSGHVLAVVSSYNARHASGWRISHTGFYSSTTTIW